MNRPLQLLMLAAALGGMPGCGRSPDPVVQHMRMTEGWTKAFAQRYPAPLAGLAEPPNLGRTGEVGPSRMLDFILTDFPIESMPELEKWLREKMTANHIQEVRLHCLFPIVGALLEQKMAEYRQREPALPEGAVVIQRSTIEPAELFRGSVDGRTIVLRADGSREERGRTNPPSPSFMGRPIPSSGTSAVGRE